MGHCVKCPECGGVAKTWWQTERYVAIVCDDCGYRRTLTIQEWYEITKLTPERLRKLVDLTRGNDD